MGGDLMKTNYKLRGNEKVHIVPISDMHIGSEQFNAEFFDYRMDLLSNMKADKRIYLCGDLMEAANKQVGNASFRTDMTLDDQIDFVIKTFKPFRKDIVNMAIGNHEARLVKDFDLDVNKVVARALDVPYGNQFLDTFSVNGNKFTVYSAHGKGSSAHHHTAQSKMIRDTQHVLANMFLNGHNHRCDHFSVPQFVRTDEGKTVGRKHYVFTGSFLKYTGYASAMQLPILPEAFIQLAVNKDMRVLSNQYNIDEVAPQYLDVGDF
jgi:hypothetical protein